MKFVSLLLSAVIMFYSLECVLLNLLLNFFGMRETNLIAQLINLNEIKKTNTEIKYIYIFNK
jgi:hypothetical protein